MEESFRRLRVRMRRIELGERKRNKRRLRNRTSMQEQEEKSMQETIQVFRQKLTHRLIIGKAA